MSAVEQRYAIKFCFKLGKSATETFDLLQLAYHEDSLSRARIFEWHKRFRDGREDVEDDEGRGRPNTSVNENTVGAVQQVLHDNPHLSVGKVAASVGISKGSCHSILKEELGLSRVCARWVPRLLTPEMKASTVASCEENLQRRFREGLAFLKKIVTGDESWVHFYDPLTKQQSSLWKAATDPTPVKGKAEKSAGKVLLVVFFDSEGILYHRYIPKGQTINAQLYIEILQTLRDQIARKRPHMAGGNWLLLHDNAPPHTARATLQFLGNNNIETLSHPPYSPDLAPSDFWLFPNLKMPLRGKRFPSDNELIGAADGVLRDLQKDGLLHVFEKWESRMRKCVELGGGYIEKT